MWGLVGWGGDEVINKQDHTKYLKDAQKPKGSKNVKIPNLWGYFQSCHPGMETNRLQILSVLKSASSNSLLRYSFCFLNKNDK
jgi:hypothetical protein